MINKKGFLKIKFRFLFSKNEVFCLTDKYGMQLLVNSSTEW